MADGSRSSQYPAILFGGPGARARHGSGRATRRRRRDHPDALGRSQPLDQLGGDAQAGEGAERERREALGDGGDRLAQTDPFGRESTGIEQAGTLAASPRSALLRETDAPITEIAFRTGWRNLGTGESPGALRARERAAPHDLEAVPACFLRAAFRPDLTIAVSEKRRQEAGGNPEDTTEVP